MQLLYLLKTVFCKRFFYFTYYSFLFGGLLMTTASGQQISGYIYDQNKAPVAYVFVQNLTHNTMGYSDETGYFDLFGNNLPGDTLVFSRIGYHSRKIVIDTTELSSVFLVSRTVNLPAITVEGAYQQSKQPTEDLVKIQKSTAVRDIASRKIFSSIPGAYVKSYGGSAGISTLSMDGAPSRHTKILINGFDITNAQNGQVDLSRLPENFISNIAYTPYAKSAFHQGSSEGRVNISPWQAGNAAFYSTGSYGYENYGLTLALDRNRFTFKMIAGQSSDDGDYSAYNPVLQKEEKRDNNYINRDYVSVKFKSILTQSLFTRILYLYSSQERGVSGQIWSPTPESFRTDNFHLLGMKTGWALRRGAGVAKITFRKSKDHFYSSPAFGFPYDSRHKVTTLRYNLSQNIEFHNQLTYNFAIKANQDILNSRETGNHHRLTWQVSNALEMNTNQLTITPAFHYNWSPDLYSESTYDINVDYPLALWRLHSIAFSHGIHFYYPSFNDLYWKPGGNPNLNAEETAASMISIQLSLLAEADFNVMAFHKTSNNLIQWKPTQSYWQPMNIAQSLRQGIKAIYYIKFDQLPISGFLNYTYNHSENKQSQQSLLYTPRHSAGLNIDLTLKSWQLHYQIHYTDRRITRYSWPNDITIDPIVEQTVGVSFDWEFRYGRISNSLLVENLADENYETIKGYPEPGRLFKYRIQYSINKN